LAAFLAACGRGSGAPDQPVDALPAAVAAAKLAGTPVNPAIVAADNAFGLTLFDTLLTQNAGSNVAISPLSVALALQILYNGAAGSTQQAMAQTLGLGALSTGSLNDQNAALQASLISADPDVQLTVADSLWIDQSSGQVSASFTQRDQDYYGALVGALSGAPATVNAWVDSETHGLITTLLPPGEYQYAIMANVLYFKGAWTTSFDASLTTAAPFTLRDGSQTSAELMQQTSPFPYASGTLHGNDFQAMRMPYGKGRFSMLIVLPAAGVDLNGFVTGVTAADLTAVTAQLQSTTVSVVLPRFTASYANSLITPLTSLGMGIAFQPNANFSSLAPGFWVNLLQHETVIEVDETGTVAAAATGVGTTAVEEYPQMVMNRPFLYAIQDDQTGELLFVGVLMDPTSSSP
jgi:serpin B